jgi:hypothetical protein
MLNEIWRRLDPRRSISEELVQQDYPDNAVHRIGTPTGVLSDHGWRTPELGSVFHIGTDSLGQHCTPQRAGQPYEFKLMPACRYSSVTSTLSCQWVCVPAAETPKELGNHSSLGLDG